MVLSRRKNDCVQERVRERERERERAMQAWQIEATADGHVKWIPATVDRGRLRQPPQSEETLGCSMDDLLLDAWTRIQREECASRKEEEEKLRGKEGQSTMFCTGLGRSVSMSWSSVEKAKAVMEVSTDGEIGDCNGEFPMFQTGLGQPVLEKQSSVEKAHALLENHSSGSCCSYATKPWRGFSSTTKSNSSRK